MPLRATTIRFDDTAAQLVGLAAQEAGVSFSQFVREAALIRAVMRATARERGIAADDVARLIHECSERVIELSSVANPEES